MSGISSAIDFLTFAAVDTFAGGLPFAFPLTPFLNAIAFSLFNQWLVVSLPSLMRGSVFAFRLLGLVGVFTLPIVAVK
jgi:hypothetical protein